MDEKKRAGSRWGTLATGVMWGLFLWMDIQEYQTIVSISHIYTPEELARTLDVQIWTSVFHMILAVLALWEFLIWKLPRPGMGDLMEGLGYLTGGLAWGLLWFVSTPVYWEGWMTFVWIVALVLLLGCGVYNLWQYRKQKLYEETL